MITLFSYTLSLPSPIKGEGYNDHAIFLHPLHHPLPSRARVIMKVLIYEL